MQYMRSLQFIMDRKNWMMNILMATLCLLSAQIIPIVGQIVLEGWLFNVIDSLHRDPEHKHYPDFDFNQFTEYLSRGIWPMLVYLVAMVVIVPMMIVMYVVIFVGALALLKSAPVLFVLLILVMLALILLVSVVISFVTIPASLYAGLSRGFDFNGMVAFVKDFNKRMFKELRITVLVLFAAWLILPTLGLIAFCIGAFVAEAALMMAQHHLQFQLYELYLQRGGTPIPLPVTSSTSPPPPLRDESEPDERYRPAP